MFIVDYIVGLGRVGNDAADIYAPRFIITTVPQ